MILFSYTPESMMIESLAPILHYNKDYFDGIMDDGYQFQLGRDDYHKPLRIYLVGVTKTRTDGSDYYEDPLAIVAFNESDACRHYFEWKGTYGNIITILANNAGKATVAPPK